MGNCFTPKPQTVTVSAKDAMLESARQAPVEVKVKSITLQGIDSINDLRVDKKLKDALPFLGI